MKTKHWAVMWQNLKISQADPRCPQMWEVPITPDGGGNVLAMAYGSEASDRSKEDCEAVARLIAAAPDLLAACKECRIILIREIELFKALGYVPNTVNECALAAVEEAIKKAEEQS